MQAWSWLLANAAAISAAASIATLFVWILYLQLFYAGYRRQMRAKILITRGGGHSIKSRCIITNMSPELVFVSAIVIELRFENRALTCSLSDIERGSYDGRDRRSELLQGPLASGDYLDIGSFEELVSSGLEDKKLSLSMVDSINVIVAGNYALHDQLVAAERSFDIQAVDERQLIEPQQATANQIRSRHGRRRIAALLRELAARRPAEPNLTNCG